MLFSGLMLLGFSTSVVLDIVTRTIGKPWLWLQEVTMTFFVYGIFIGSATATRRNDHLYLLMASKFVGVRFSSAIRAALPLYCVFLITIAFAIYFPKVVLWLPKQVIPQSVGCFKNPSGPGWICPK